MGRSREAPAVLADPRQDDDPALVLGELCLAAPAAL
jgi:hypothetical protein